MPRHQCGVQDVAVVFATEYVRNMTMIAPMDTGFYSGVCESRHPTPCHEHASAASCNGSVSRDMKHRCQWDVSAGLCRPWDICGNSTVDACNRTAIPDPRPGEHPFCSWYPK